MSFTNRHSKILKSIHTMSLENFIETMASIEYTLLTNNLEPNVALAPLEANFQIPSIFLKTKNSFKVEKVFSNKFEAPTWNDKLDWAIETLDSIELEETKTDKKIEHDDRILESLLIIRNGNIQIFHFSGHKMEVLNERKSQEVYKLLHSLKNSENIKIGMNQSIKSLNAGNALLVIIANDSIPEALVAPLPVLCEQKGVQYVFIDSKTALGKAVGLEIDVLSCSISVSKHEDPTKLQDRISKTLK